jgi:chromosome segregation ATPase
MAMKFEVYEKYLSEQQGNAQKSEQVMQKVVEAERLHKSLISEWETTMANSIKTGKDATKSLAELDEKIDKAKRDLERAQREQDVYNRVQREVSVSKDDIIAAWNRELNPEYYEKEIGPALEQLEAAKKVYYDAMCAYFDKVHAIEDFRQEVSNQLGYDFPYYFHIRSLQTTAEFDRYFIRQSNMDNAQSRRR